MVYNKKSCWVFVAPDACFI